MCLCVCVCVCVSACTCVCVSVCLCSYIITVHQTVTCTKRTEDYLKLQLYHVAIYILIKQLGKSYSGLTIKIVAYKPSSSDVFSFLID